MSEDKSDKNQEPRIISDEDWKTQAQAEKQLLSEEVDAQKNADDTAGEGPAAQSAPDQAQERQIPPASITTLISSIMTQAFMAMGAVEDPRTKRPILDPELAKHHIDTLSVIEEKTKGNLTPEEQKMLDRAIYECRMQYVAIAQGGSQG